MSKVGLTTCFLDNYGAYLQAYALSNVIESLGYDCEILQYIEPQGYFKPSFSNFLKNSFLYNKIRCISCSYKKAYLCEKVKRKSFHKFRKQHLKFSRKMYDSFDQLREANKDYDIFVCGSDQIWNPTFYFGNNKAYFLNFAEEGKRKISYAPSIGLDKIPEQYAKDFTELVGYIDYLSVRESTGVEIIKELSGRDAKHVLDPTLLLDGEKWSAILSDHRLISKPYIFCYLFGDHEEYDTAIQRLRYISGSELDIVIIPFSETHLNNTYTKVYDAGPLEFLNLIRNAQYVITDSFHATVFSILFSRQFFTLPRFKKNQANSMNSRIYSLLNAVGAQERIIEYSQVDSFIHDKMIDFGAIHSKIAAMRNSSIEYLKGALEGK